MIATEPRKGIRPCCRCGTAPRHGETYLCLPCVGEVGVSEGPSLRAIEVRYPGDRRAQRQAAMAELGWKGGWG